MTTKARDTLSPPFLCHAGVRALVAGVLGIIGFGTLFTFFAVGPPFGLVIGSYAVSPALGLWLGRVLLREGEASGTSAR